MNIYYATSEFKDVGTLEWAGHNFVATAYRQNAEGAVINTISTGTDGYTAEKSGWQIYEGPTANPADAVFIMGGDGMLGSPNAPEVLPASNGLFTFENSTFESAHWTVASAGRTGDSANVFRRHGHSQGNPPFAGEYLLAPGGQCADDGQSAVGIVRSLEFQLTGDGSISYKSNGGMGGTESVVGLTSEELVAQGVSGSGFQGAALRLVDSDEYVLSARRTQNVNSWQTQTFSEDILAELYEADPDAWYTLDFIDAVNGGWGWSTYDDVSIPYLADALTLDQNQYHFLYVDGNLVAMTDPVPEPSTFVLLFGALGFVGWTYTRRRRKNER